MAYPHGLMQIMSAWFTATAAITSVTLVLLLVAMIMDFGRRR